MDHAIVTTILATKLNFLRLNQQRQNSSFSLLCPATEESGATNILRNRTIVQQLSQMTPRLALVMRAFYEYNSIFNRGRLLTYASLTSSGLGIWSIWDNDNCTGTYVRTFVGIHTIYREAARVERNGQVTFWTQNYMFLQHENKKRWQSGLDR